VKGNGTTRKEERQNGRNIEGNIERKKVCCYNEAKYSRPVLRYYIHWLTL